MKIILTGATGFVGSRFLDFLLSKGQEVVCIPSEMIKGKITTEKFSALSDLIKRFNSNAIIHTAAISNTVYSQQHPDESYIANVELPLVMAKLAKEQNCKLISCSSDQVYSACDDTEAHSEDEVLEPKNVYGCHKLEAEKRLMEVNSDSVSLRLTWMYDMPLYKTKTNENFVFNLYKSALAGREGVYSINDFRGLTYVRSVAENILKALELPGGVYNFGSENEKDMYETACCFSEALGIRQQLIKPNNTAETRSLRMDCSKIKSYGINIESTSEGIRKMVTDYPGFF